MATTNTVIRKGSIVTILAGARPDLKAAYNSDYEGWTGKVLGVQHGTKHVLVKLKGLGCSISFAQHEVKLLTS